LRYPDIAIAGGSMRLTLELQLDASGRVLAATPAARAAAAAAATEVMQHLQSELEGAAVDTAARRLCLNVLFDERDARLDWRLTEPAVAAPCQAG
jgi:ribosomal protein S12 methylthiotransferase accessory factor YcaO